MLKKISIHNFKCLRNVEDINLAKVNLLTGINGRGKSSFLQTLLVLAQTWRKSAYDILIPSDSNFVSLGSYSDIHNASAIDEPMRIHLITDHSFDNDFELAYTASPTRNDIGERLSFNVGGQAAMAEEEDVEEEGMETEDSDDQAAITPDIQLPTISTISDHPSLIAIRDIYYVAANRQPATDRYKPQPDTGSIHLMPDGSNVLDVMARLGEGSIDSIEKMLKEIFGDARIDLHTIGDSYELTMDSGSKQARLFSPINVGYGFSYILTMLTALEMASPGSTVIIENPEAHLHPGAQANVMKIIIERAIRQNIQMFVETHSDHIVNGALVGIRQRDDFNDSDLEILFFSDNGVTNLDITPRGHILQPPSDFCDQYARDLDILYPVDEW